MERAAMERAAMETVALTRRCPEAVGFNVERRAVRQNDACGHMPNRISQLQISNISRWRRTRQTDGAAELACRRILDGSGLAPRVFVRKHKARSLQLRDRSSQSSCIGPAPVAVGAGREEVSCALLDHRLLSAVRSSPPSGLALSCTGGR
jgi:hypothetical protein